MSATYQCPTCQSQTTTIDGIAPECVGCDETMVIVAAALVEDHDETDDAKTGKTLPPLAPVNVGAYQNGLEEIEKAKQKADADEREYKRAKDYATAAKKRLETSESDLRDVIKKVADRLRPRPLFEAQDHHTDEELVVLLADLNVSTTIQKVRLWTPEMKADARTWAVSAHSEQPRLMPTFLWAPSGDVESGATSDTPKADEPPPVLEGETAVAYAQRRVDELAAEQAQDAEPPVGDDATDADATDEDGDSDAAHWYPRAVDTPKAPKAARTRRGRGAK